MFGAIRFSRAVLPHLRARGAGRIINMTTPGGKVPRRNALPTSASRALGINLTKAMANEYASENILVNTICLGLIKSAQHERRWERDARDGESLGAYYGRMGANVPVGRYGEAEEVGDLVAFLASDRAAFITGTAITHRRRRERSGVTPPLAVGGAADRPAPRVESGRFKVSIWRERTSCGRSDMKHRPRWTTR